MCVCNGYIDKLRSISKSTLIFLLHKNVLKCGNLQCKHKKKKKNTVSNRENNIYLNQKYSAWICPKCELRRS